MDLYSEYVVEKNGTMYGKVVLPYSVTWPSFTEYPSHTIVVRFTCGWASAALVPYTIKAAIKMVMAKLYEGRGEDVVGTIVTESGDKVVDRLLASWRLWGEF